MNIIISFNPGWDHNPTCPSINAHTGRHWDGPVALSWSRTIDPVILFNLRFVLALGEWQVEQNITLRKA